MCRVKNRSLDQTTEPPTLAIWQRFWQTMTESGFSQVRETFGPEKAVVIQGEMGMDMYIVEKGQLAASVRPSARVAAHQPPPQPLYREQTPFYRQPTPFQPHSADPPGGLPVQVTGVGVVKEYVTAGEYFGELAVLTDGSEVRHSLGQPNQRPAASHCCSCCCCCTSLLARACTICRWLSRSPTRATTAGQTQGGRHHQDRRAPNGAAEADPGGVPPSHLRQARGGHPAPLLPRLRQDLRAAVVRGRQD